MTGRIYKIYGRTASDADWEEFVGFFRKNYKIEDEFLKDGELDRGEILRTLKENQYECLYFDHLSRGNVTLFFRLNHILKKWGFELLKEMDWPNTHYFPSAVWKQREFVLESVNRDGMSLEYADAVFKKDHEIVLAAIRQNWRALQFASAELKNDRETVLTAVRQDGSALEFASTKFRSNREAVLEAIKTGATFQFASDDLKRNKAFILEACQYNSGIFDYVSEKLKRDREFMAVAIGRNAMVLDYAEYELKDNKSIVLAAVKRNGLALQYASRRCQMDRSIILMAVSQNGLSLEFASTEWRRNREIVLKAVRQNGRALLYASEQLRGDQEIVLEAVRTDTQSLFLADRAFFSDKHFLLKVAKNVEKDLIGCIADSAADELKRDRDFFLELAKLDNSFLGGSKFLNIRESIWSDLLRNADMTGLFTGLLPKEALTSFQSFRQTLHDRYNIDFVTMATPLSLISEILRNRIMPTNSADGRPIAIVIYPKSDWNGAFANLTTAGRLVGLGYKVLYYEAAKEDDVEKYLSMATDGGKDKASVVVLGGHGTSTTLALDAGPDESVYLDTSDFRPEESDINVGKYIIADGDVILKSCSNGEGGKGYLGNLANMIANVLPHGVRIHSVMEPATIYHMAFDNQGRIDVKHTGFTYKTHGRLRR